MSKKRIISVVLLLFILMTAMIGCNNSGEQESETVPEDTAAVENEETEASEETEKIETQPVEIINRAELNDYAPHYTLINRDDGFTDLSVGTFVAAYNLLEYGVDNTGEEDCTKMIQKLLDKIGNIGGGTLYIPEGFYRIEGDLTIPKGVTLRGDWKKPEAGKTIEGTVLMAYTGRDKGINTTAFIDMEVGAGVMDVAIWYPEQLPGDIVQYSPTITMGVNGYFGNEYNNVKNVTFVNSYIAVHFSYTNGGASPVVNGCYGSPLYMGVEVDNIADVGRVEGVYLSPEYWIGCGLYEKIGMSNPFESEDNKTAVRDYIYNNATGVIMRRNDWSYACNLVIEGYGKGFAAMPSVASPSSTPNGHNYAFTLTNCKTGVSIEASNSVGIMFADVNIKDCETGISIAPSTSDVAQFTDCTIDADIAINIDETSGTRLMMTACTIESGEVLVNGGTLNITDSDFKNTSASANITIGASGRANVIGNRFEGEAKIVNNSFFTSQIDHTPIDAEEVPKFEAYIPETKLPAKMELYNVEDFNAAEGLKESDNTQAIQNALNTASENGGGIVFIPAGHWIIDGTLTIPSGVELRGACDNSITPHGEGTVLETTHGKGDFTAEPFISIESGAGLRSVTINYPDQVYSSDSSWKPDEYPWAIRGLGDNIYVINVGVRACYAALDLFTNKCDDFYVDYLTGHMFNYGVKIGGDSENGYLSNAMCNTIVYACGHESKFGSFPNSPKSGVSIDPVYDYGYANLEFLILGDTKNLKMYNCFNFGAYSGIKFISEGSGGPTGISLGLGLDADEKAFYISEGVSTAEFDFINTQFVSLGQSDIYYIYSEANNSFDITLFASDYWGGPTCGVYMGENSGTVRLVNAHFQNPGNSAFAELYGGLLDVKSSSINYKNPTILKKSNGYDYISVIASVADPAGVKSNTGVWEYNLSTTREFSMDGAMSNSYDRSSWRARASHFSGGTKRALDGKIDTRWDTATVQVPGMWFEVDFKEELTFNYLILDVGSSTGDAPVEYKVYVKNDGDDDWGEPIASGEKGNGIIHFDTVTATDLRIEQNGSSSGNYWSIHELYVVNVD